MLSEFQFWGLLEGKPTGRDSAAPAETAILSTLLGTAPQLSSDYSSM
ncbi:hypothetical protein [Candidatus Poriferisodalis sp.]